MTATETTTAATGMSRSPVLSVEGCTVRYGGVYANTDVSLTLHPGELVGLIGPNGAGKSTCIDAISGFASLDSGQILLDGQPIHHLDAPDRAQLGLSRTFQSLDLFDDLSVADNLTVARGMNPWRSLFSDAVKPLRRQRRDDAVSETLERCGLSDLADRKPSELSHGQRNLVALARALASRPKVLLVDEPAAGLDLAESEALGQLLRSLTSGFGNGSDDGLAILLVDHDMSLVMGVCDRLAVLDFGHVIADGTPDEVRQDAAVRAAYLGTDDDPLESASGADQ